MSVRVLRKNQRNYCAHLWVWLSDKNDQKSFTHFWVKVPRRFTVPLPSFRVMWFEITEPQPAHFWAGSTGAILNHICLSTVFILSTRSKMTGFNWCDFKSHLMYEFRTLAAIPHFDFKSIWNRSILLLIFERNKTAPCCGCGSAQNMIDMVRLMCFTVPVPS